ncbi:MAG: ATP-binding protein [Bacteroidia bacterium]|nr:ATP-binding protein [Bacteroidia bacterium]
MGKQNINSKGTDFLIDSDDGTQVDRKNTIIEKIKLSTSRGSAAYLFLILILGIFIGETTIMLFIDALPPLSQMGTALLDSTLLLILAFPVLYFFVFHPMATYITERKQAEELLILQSTALNAAANAILITHRDGHIEWVNPAFTKLTGYRLEEVTGAYPRSLKSGKHDAVFYKNLWDTILAGEIWQGEIINKRKDGSEYTEEMTITPVKAQTGEIIHFIAIKHEITERKKIEEELSKAKAEAEQANLAKSEFLSRMSHELRTPMNSILGFAQLLEMGELNPGQQKGVHHIMRSGKHLLDLINEVLDISRIEAGQLSLSLEPIQIKGVINEMTDLVSRQADEREIKIELVYSENNYLFLRSDKQRLKQILLNLINNAIKYNRSGGSIFLETMVMPKNEAGVTPVRILVRDTGLGIAEEDLPKLFNPFERIGAEKSETEGSGLGLSVIKKLTEAMGGKVGVESVMGEGSTFWVELPMSDEPSERDKTRSKMKKPGHRLEDKTGTILYIEDNISNIELVEEIIASQRLGLTLITSPNGRMALPLAITNKPNLILLDLNLPDIHGSKVLQLLQSDENTSNIPVVVISADAMPQQIAQLMASGAKRYIIKPIDLNLLLKIIDEFVV